METTLRLLASHDGKQRSVWRENTNTVDSSVLHTLLEIQSLTASYHNYKSCSKNLAWKLILRQLYQNYWKAYKI